MRHAGEQRLAGAGQAANRNQARRWRIDPGPRRLKIAPRVRNDLGLIRMGPLELRERDLGPNRSANGHVRRQQAECIEVPVGAVER